MIAGYMTFVFSDFTLKSTTENFPIYSGEQKRIFLKSICYIRKQKCLVCTPLTLKSTVKQRAWSGVGGCTNGGRARFFHIYEWFQVSITGQSLIYQLHDSATDLSTSYVRRQLFGSQGNPDKHFGATVVCHAAWGGATSVTFLAPRSFTALQESVKCDTAFHLCV
jgi:hypothetical protein